MNLSKLSPKTVFWTGVGTTLAGAALVVLLPAAILPFLYQATAQGQGLLVALDIVLRVVNVVLPPLGAALIGASAVMAYLDRLEARRTSPETRHEILSGRRTGDGGSGTSPTP